MEDIIYGVYTKSSDSKATYSFRTRDSKKLVEFLETLEDSGYRYLNIEGTITVVKTPEQEKDTYDEDIIGDEEECFV